MTRLAVLAAALLVSQTTLLSQSTQQMLTLEVRAFRGTDDVTHETRITLHKAGDHAQAVAQVPIGAPPMMKVPPGIYDAQAIQEQDRRVVNIRWAERLVVMPYPDEAGHHLEVINFTNGYGALQVRGAAGQKPAGELAVFAAADRGRPVVLATWHEKYALFVVPANQYDVRVKRGTWEGWHSAIDVPLDRTRLLIVP
jgi:hypothetical protein